MVPKIGLTGATPLGVRRRLAPPRPVPRNQASLTRRRSPDTIHGSFAAPLAVLGAATMYAVIATGGKQYRVQKGVVVRMEKLARDHGARVRFNQSRRGGD